MAGTGLVAGEVVVDALPYFDQGYEAPGVREAVSSGFCVTGSALAGHSAGRSAQQCAARTLSSSRP